MRDDGGEPGDDWNADLLDLVDALLAAEVDFLVVGAFALAQHGLLRATADIDIVVRASPARDEGSGLGLPLAR